MSICNGTCVETLLWNETGAFAHICSAGLFVLGLVVLLRYFIRPWIIVVTSFLVVVVYASIKEFWYDVHYETDEEAGKAWVDFVTYLSGAILGSLLSLPDILFAGNHTYSRMTGDINLE